jgi:hypothetical protein
MWKSAVTIENLVLLAFVLWWYRGLALTLSALGITCLALWRAIEGEGDAG